MKKTLIAVTLFLALSPLAALAQAQPQSDAAQKDVSAQISAPAVPTYAMTDLILTAGY